MKAPDPFDPYIGPCAAAPSDYCTCGCEEPLSNAELKLISAELRLKRAIELLEGVVIAYEHDEDFSWTRADIIRIEKFLKEQK